MTDFVTTASIIELDKHNLVKLCYGGFVLGSSKFPLLHLMLNSKVVKIDLKIIILLRWSKSVTHTVLISHETYFLTK